MDSEIPIADSSRRVAAPREAGIGLVGDQGAEGEDQQDGSNLSSVVEPLCLHRTWKTLAFRVSSNGRS